MQFKDLQVGDMFRFTKEGNYSYKKIDDMKYIYELTMAVYVTHPTTEVIKVKTK